MAEDFIQRVDRRLRELQRQEADLAAQEDGVHRRRVALQHEITKLEYAADAWRDLMGVSAEAEPEAGLFGPDLPTGTIADMAASIIVREGGTAPISLIRDELARLGKVKPGHRGYGTVYTVLSRSPRFAKKDRGSFGLTKAEQITQAAQQRGAPSLSGTYVLDGNGELAPAKSDD